MRIEVRPMTVADKPAVMSILGNTPQFKPVEVTVAEELIDAYLEDPTGSGYLTLVGEANSQIQGYICYGPTPLTEGTWDVYWLAVNRGEQGHGVGTRLLSSAEADITRRRGRLILIETSSKDSYEQAQRFYAARGYDMISRISDFYEPGDDRLTYLKKVA